MAGIEAKPTLSKSPGLDYHLPSQVFRHTHDPVLIVMWSSIIIVCRAIKLTIVSATGMQQGRGQGGQLPPQILADQLPLSQPGGADYAHHSTTSSPKFSDLASGLHLLLYLLAVLELEVEYH